MNAADPTPAQKAALQLEARRRVERALRKIEEAQGLIGDACGILSSLQYAAPEWRATSKLYDRVRAHWYRVRNGLQLAKKSGKVRLDPMAAQAILDAVAQRAAGQP